MEPSLFPFCIINSGARSDLRLLKLVHSFLHEHLSQEDGDCDDKLIPKACPLGLSWHSL
uniref:Uncharacterized protein n=1 Tax=Anguilla anguilla TaxID=7936 RepID=A0A0E9TYI6_ANGAN